ncbi:hypothetical protein CTI14_71820, partial [Methylobacterium radiotolerans]
CSSPTSCRPAGRARSTARSGAGETNRGLGTPALSASSVPHRHPADRLAGRGALRDPGLARRIAVWGHRP